MNVIRKALVLCLMIVVVASCATTQSRYSMLGDSFSPKPEGYDVQVFQEIPQRSFVRISRLDVHLEKTYLIGSSFDDALQELKKQARLSGADAIVDVKEYFSRVGETKMYHVTATGIHYTDTQ